MPQVTVAVGYLPDGTFSAVYAGEDSAAAQKALNDQGQAGTIVMGFLVKSPTPTETFRFGPIAEPPEVPVPAPSISTLVPNSAPQDIDVTLAITGSGFDPASAKVIFGSMWHGPVELTPNAGATQTDLSVLVPLNSLMTGIALYQVKVVNGDGQESGVVGFTVFSSVPAPTITALNPNTGPANADITLAITGANFDSGATVTIGSAHSLVPTNVTPTDLSVVVEAANIAQAGTLPVSVNNPDGQQSNPLDFTVT